MTEDQRQEREDWDADDIFVVPPELRERAEQMFGKDRVKVDDRISSTSTYFVYDKRLGRVLIML